VRCKVDETLAQGQWVPRRLALGLCVLAALIGAPSASAHARLLATEPEQGAVVPKAPARVSFTFDEPVRSGGHATLSGGQLADDVSLSARLVRGGRQLVVPLPASVADGDYVVTWRVVSDDGHLETGALAFGVGLNTPAPAAVVGQRTQRDTGLALARWIFLAGLLAAAGIAAVRLALGGREPRLAAGALATALAVAAGGALLELSRIPGVLDTRFGLVTAVAAGVAAAGALAALASLRVRVVLRAAEAAAVGLVVAPALAGHALASDRPVWLAFPADLVHTAAAAVWIGGVVWLGLLAARGRGLAGTAARFTRIALVAIAVLGLSGVARAAAELTSVDELRSTSYGRLLVLKSVLFAVLLAAGWGSSRLARRLGAGNALARFRLSLGGETLLLAALVGAVAALGSVTPPRNRAKPLPPALPGPPVVFGRTADELAVGIAAAARDGRLGVRATVLAQTGLGANGLAVEIEPPGGGWRDAEPCGTGIYCAGTPVSTPAPRVRVRITRPDGRADVVGFTLPQHPQHALAKRIVRAAEHATRELKTVVIHERLSADPRLALKTEFTIESPDKMTYRSVQVKGGKTTPAGAAIVIGAARYDRTGPGAPYVKSELQPLDQPVPDWRTALDASLLGTARLDGRPVWRVSFRDPTVPAWFEVAIDRRTSRPLRVDMTAAAHFMVRDWGSFDDPVSIEPP
jgi:copper transport protein